MYHLFVLLLLLACDPDRSPAVSQPCALLANDDATCDGVDDDCDGHVDEDALTTRAWYPDQDGDGFGDLSGAIVACDQPPGTTDDFRDCDDTDPAVHPEAADDTCDGVDTDCDGDFDEDAEGATTFYKDTDGDGFGDADDPVIGCTAPSGAVEDETDCDATEASAHPGGSEECGNDVDEDCDGVAGEACGGLVSVALGVGDTVLQTSDTLYNEDDFYILTVRAATGGDLDGDGVDDLVIAFPYGDDHGKIYLVDGLPEGDVDITTVSRTLDGVDEDSKFGWAVELVSDVDGDGRAELAAGAPALDGDAGAVYLFAGRDGDTPADAVTTLLGEPGDEAGTSITDAGSLLGDGVRAVAVGGTGIADFGGAYVIAYGSGGTVNLADAAARVVADVAGAQTGENLSDAGDVDGDGIDDLLIGGADGDVGAAYLLYGPLAGDVLLADADARFLGEEADGTGQGLVGPGDIDGDGLDDVAVGSPAYGTAGRIHVVTGAPRGDVDLDGAWAEVVGVDLYGTLGAVLSTSGDIDGDGRADLWISDPHGTWAFGAVWLATELDPGSWLIDEVASVLRAPTPRTLASQVGGTVATGDLDGDGSPEVAITGYDQQYVNRTLGWF